MAYVREKKVPGKDGKVYRYYQLVEGERVDGKVRQRVVKHLGRHDSIEEARAAVADVVPKDDRVGNAVHEQDAQRYWVTNPARIGDDGSKPTYPVFLSEEAARSYGGPESVPEYDILDFTGPELAAKLWGTILGCDHVAVWDDEIRFNPDAEPKEILRRRTFVKRLGREGTH